MEYIYTYVTKDRYEFPLFIADSVEEMVQVRNISSSSIRAALSRSKNYGKYTRFHKIEVIEDNE